MLVVGTAHDIKQLADGLGAARGGGVDRKLGQVVPKHELRIDAVHGFGSGPVRDAQRSLSLGDVVNSIEFRLDDLDASDETTAMIEQAAGDSYSTSTWMERNQALFGALETEQLVIALIIGLIMIVAALNILISLVMMVVEKTEDIAILKSMGTGQAQIRRIFIWQGIIIGGLGTSIGLCLGHFVCWLCERYQLIRLNAEVYGLEYVPFAPHPLDGIYVAIVAILICYVITIYPSGNAARIDPAEVLRYE